MKVEYMENRTQLNSGWKVNESLRTDEWIWMFSFPSVLKYMVTFCYYSRPETFEQDHCTVVPLTDLMKLIDLKRRFTVVFQNSNGIKKRESVSEVEKKDS